MIDQYRNKILQGHVIDVLKKLPDDSVDMMITSPPYWGLRDYDTDHQIWGEIPNICDDHNWEQDGNQPTKLGTGGITHDINVKVQRPKSSPTYHCTNSRDFDHGQNTEWCKAWKGSLGLEPKPSVFIKHLLIILKEVKRVLKPTGTMWVNLGDTYAGSSSRASKGGRSGFTGEREGVFKLVGASQKSLIGIPDRLKIALINNDFICRNEIIWYKPNCMPSSADDRFTNDFEKLYFFSLGKKYYFEQQFEPFTDASIEDLLRRKTMTYYKEDGSESKYITSASAEELDGNKEGRTRDQLYGDLGKGRNMRTTWKYNNLEHEAEHRQGMHKERGKGTVMKRHTDQFPTQKEFVDWMRKNAPMNRVLDYVNEGRERLLFKRSTLEHWYRYDDSGFCFPELDDWVILGFEYFEVDLEEDDGDITTMNVGHPKDPFPILGMFYEETDAIGKYSGTGYGGDGSSFRGHSGYTKADGTLMINPRGRNKRTTWEIQTKPFADAHFAVFPEELIDTPIKAGCPTEVCNNCGAPKIIE